MSEPQREKIETLAEFCGLVPGRFETAYEFDENGSEIWDTASDVWVQRETDKSFNPFTDANDERLVLDKSFQQINDDAMICMALAQRYLRVLYKTNEWSRAWFSRGKTGDISEAVYRAIKETE